MNPAATNVRRLMNFHVSEVTPSDTSEIGQFMSEVIAVAVAADAGARVEMIENARSNLSWAAAHPKDCCHLKCVADEKIVGVVLVKNFWNLCSLFVAPELHRRGIGRALMSVAMERCRGKSERNSLWLNAAANAVPFYEKLGFSPRSTTQPLPAGFQSMQLALS